MIKLDTPKEVVTKATKTVADTTVSAATKAKEVGSAAASTATETAKTIFEKTQAVTGKGVEKVSDLPLGDKNVGERAHETVETVQEKIDVEQIQEQVARLRDQIESVLGTWKESFRPTTTEDAGVKTADKVVEDEGDTKKKTTATKTAAAKKKTTATKTAAAKKTSTATKTAAAKKTSTPKASTPKKTTTKKPSTK